MKNKKSRSMLALCILLGLPIFAISCGGGETQEEPLVDIGGIQVMFSITGVTQSVGKQMIYEGSPDSLSIRPYQIAISTDPSCTSGFVNILDDMTDTSDCSEGADTSRFLSTNSTVQLGENDEIPVGDYQCIKMIFCDTLIFTASTEHCNGTFYYDTYTDWSPGGTSEPQVSTVYFGTEGDLANVDVPTYGKDPESPIHMAGAIGVAKDEITTFTFVFDFRNRVYFNSGDSQVCGLDTPAVSAVAQ